MKSLFNKRIYLLICKSLGGLPRWPSDKEPACQCRRCGFSPWVGKIPWRRTWQPTAVPLPGELHRQRRLVGCSPWSCRVRYDWAAERQQSQQELRRRRHGEAARCSDTVRTACRVHGNMAAADADWDKRIILVTQVLLALLILVPWCSKMANVGHSEQKQNITGIAFLENCTFWKHAKIPFLCIKWS